MSSGRMPAFNSLRARFNLSGFEGVEPMVHGIELRLFEEPMAYAIPLWTPPALPVAGSAEQFPVRRIFCVGRNYAEHQKEMGGDGREQPFFFLKSEHALVVALGKGGRRIDARRANEHIFGYTVGLDMTRRDLQQWGKDHGRPWDFGKN